MCSADMFADWESILDTCFKRLLTWSHTAPKIFNELKRPHPLFAEAVVKPLNLSVQIILHTEGSSSLIEINRQFEEENKHDSS